MAAVSAASVTSNVSGDTLACRCVCLPAALQAAVQQRQQQDLRCWKSCWCYVAAALPEMGPTVVGLLLKFALMRPAFTGVGSQASLICTLSVMLKYKRYHTAEPTVGGAGEGGGALPTRSTC